MGLLVIFFIVVAILWMAGKGPWGPNGRFGSGNRAADQPQPPRAWAPGAPQPQARPEDEAIRILADRLANGEIAPDEYLARVSVLRQQQPPMQPPTQV